MTDPDNKTPETEEEGIYVAMGGCGMPGREKHRFDWASYIAKNKPIWDARAAEELKADHGAAPQKSPDDPKASQG